MCNAATSMLTSTSFPRIFLTSLTRWGVGLFPTCIEGMDDPSTSPTIAWSSDKRLLHNPPRQTLLDVPIVQRHNSYLSRQMSKVRELFYSARKEQKSFDTVYRALQAEIDQAPAILKEIKNPSFQVPELAAAVIGRGIGEDMLRSAVLLLNLGDNKSIQCAADMFVDSAALYVVTHGHDADALLKELAYAAYDTLYYRTNEYDDLDHRHRENLMALNAEAIWAWSKALLSEPDPAYDAVRVFSGLRACFASHIHYGHMIPFLQRYSKLHPKEQHPDIAAENNLRTAWAQLAQTNWESVAKEIGAAASVWEHLPHRSKDIEKLKWFLEGAQKIARSMG
ncbi:MAG: hypothetical protein ABH871_00265 [Pseudomonadota bacterium]